MVAYAVSLIKGKADAHLKGLRGASQASERWLFRGKPSTPNQRPGLVGFFDRLLKRSHKSSATLLYPSWILEDEGSFRPLPPGSIAFVGLDRHSIPGILSLDELQELRFRRERLESRSTWRLAAFLLAPVNGYWLLRVGLSDRTPLALGLQAAMGLAFLFGLESLWYGLRGACAAKKLARDAEQGQLVSLSSTSREVVDATRKQPLLLHALSEVEILGSGAIWSIDGKPASWRVHGTVPEFFPKKEMPIARAALSGRP
jgi:hypothetical protein